MDDPDLLRRAADRLEELAGRTPGGSWALQGLLASRPEVVAHTDEGSEHVAEARARTAEWIVTMRPALAGPLAGWLRAEARRSPADPHALAVARLLVDPWPR